MKNLLKADLFRVRKSKILLISVILAVFFPLLTTLLYFGIEKLAFLGIEDMAELEAAGMDLFSSSTLLASVFSLSNNLGLLVPIFSCIFIGQDISSGTMRNKLLIGNSRSRVYLSHLITSILFNAVIIAIYFVSTLLFSALFFGFDKNPPVSVLCFTVTGLLTFAFVACLSTAFIMGTKSTAVSIILTEILAVGLSLITALFGLVDYHKFRYLIYFVPTFSNSAALFQYQKLPQAMFWEGAASYVFFGAVITLVGLAVFKKKDIK